MRKIDWARRSFLAAAMMAALFDPRLAAAEADGANLDKAVAAHQNGDVAGALAEAERFLTRAPDDLNALFLSARFNLELGNGNAARGRLERLLKFGGSIAQAWELMVQVAQLEGDRPRRAEAIERVKRAIQTSVDPRIRAKDSFLRDWIPVGKLAVTAADYFGRAGNEFTRYQFGLGDPRPNPGIGLLLRTDEDTTARWQETALLPPDQLLFHLDMVDQGEGGAEKIAIYEYYAGEPDYDVLRVKVLQILRGEARPLNGEPGSLAGILKP